MSGKVRNIQQPIRIADHAWQRSVMVTCNCCPHTVEATIRAVYPLTDEQCDRRLDRDLRAEGWNVDKNGETCPECTANGHHRGDS